MKPIKYWYPVKTAKFMVKEPDTHFISIWPLEEVKCRNHGRILHSHGADVRIRNVPNGVVFSSEIPRKVRAQTRMVAKENRIDILHSVSNLSGQAWKGVRSIICVQLAEAPRFRYRSGQEVFYPGEGTFHSFNKEYVPVRRWYCRFLKMDPRKTMAHPLIMVPDCRGQYVMGHAFPCALDIDGNGSHAMHCIHSTPSLGDIAPGATAKARGVVFVVKGTLQDALAYYLDWKSHLKGLCR